MNRRQLQLHLLAGGSVAVTARLLAGNQLKRREAPIESAGCTVEQ